MTKIPASLLFLSVFSCGQTATPKDADLKGTQLNGDWKTLDGPNYTIQYTRNIVATSKNE